MSDTIAYTYEFTGNLPELFPDLGVVLQPGTDGDPTTITSAVPVVSARLVPTNDAAIAAAPAPDVVDTTPPADPPADPPVDPPVDPPADTTTTDPTADAATDTTTGSTKS